MGTCGRSKTRSIDPLELRVKAAVFCCMLAFAALFSFSLMGEVLDPRQLSGCGLILARRVMTGMRLLARAGHRDRS